MSRTRILLLVTALLCAAGLGRAADAQAAELLYGVDTQNRLVAFTSQAPTAVRRIAFTGLPAGEQIVGLDVRPANKQLIALGSTSRLYRIDIATGAATAIGTTPFVPPLAGTSFGFDFNPTVDRIRVTSDTRQNLRLNPDTGANAAVDGTLTYAVGDAGAAATPRVVASAYTNSVAGATTTQLFNLEAGRDALVLQNPPNNGTLVTVGSLGVDVGDNTGFDISSVDGVAYAAIQVGQTTSSQLYTVNLTTGAATLVGRIGGRVPLRALAGLGNAPADGTAPGLGLAKAAAPARVNALLRAGARVRATCSESCTLTARIFLGSRVIGSAKSVSTDLAGSTSLKLVFTTAARKSLANRRTLVLRLVVTATDAAGNRTSKSQTIRARR
ncbi:MAG: DUF4394 domain-containing protein [Gaiellaceae bacterium]